jgi:hypothetical protein
MLLSREALTELSGTWMSELTAWVYPDCYCESYGGGAILISHN